MKIIRVFRSTALAGWIAFIMIVLFPSVYNVFATMPEVPYVRYHIIGSVVDSLGNPAADVYVFLVHKGPWSLDHGSAILYLDAEWTSDVTGMQLHDGKFELTRTYHYTSPDESDSFGVMVESPRVFGRFLSPLTMSSNTLSPRGVWTDSSSSVPYGSSSGCSCSPTNSTYNLTGTELRVTGYSIMIR